MKFLTKKSNAYIWNMAGGMLYAFQSVILLMVITRTVDLYSAGIFTIAYASANLFLTIGKYGMRNYQVTDVVPKFNFREYRNSRIATIAFMIAVSAVYVVYKYVVDGYSTEKTVIVFVMCLLKSIDAAEDVYHGLYQQQGRLDIAAKLQTIRMVGTILSFAAGLIVFRNLLTALILATVVSAVLVFGLIAVTLPEFQDKTASSITGAEARKKTVGLLKICFPLFAGTFLSFYIGNAPKYAIDKLLSEEVQACYGFISMPVFVINLLNGFIYQPILNKLAVDWSMGKKADFIKKVVRQFACVVGITVAAVAGGYLLGIPVLSILYNTDLKGYRMDLIILLLGGGMLALSGFLVIVLTIMRKQRNTIFGYALIAVLAYLFSEVFVRRYEVRGASMLYLVLMSGLTLIFLLMLILELVKMRKAK